MSSSCTLLRYLSVKWWHWQYLFHEFSAFPQCNFGLDFEKPKSYQLSLIEHYWVPKYTVLYSLAYSIKCQHVLYYVIQINVSSYLSGRTRLEPVAIVILSAIMSVASVQLIAESIQTIVSIAQEKALLIDFDNVTIGVLAATMRKFCFVSIWKSLNWTFKCDWPMPLWWFKLCGNGKSKY